MQVADYFFNWKEFSITVVDEEYMGVIGEMRLLIVSTDDGDAKGRRSVHPGQGRLGRYLRGAMTMFRKLLLGVALVALSATASQAGVGLMCSGEGIEGHFPMGGVPGFNLLSAGVWVGDKETRRENDQGLVGGIPYQQSWNDGRINIDLVDENQEKVEIRVRLVSASEYDVISGFIEIVGDNAYPVTCGVG